MKSLKCTRLLAGQNAFSYKPGFSQAFDASYSGTMLDLVNVHPLPNLLFKGRKYGLGNFMSKELQLGEFRDFFSAVSKEPKPSISDEDNAASSTWMIRVGLLIASGHGWL
jgi:hypothetical protein